MHEIRRRIKNVEKRLIPTDGHLIVRVTHYGGELPPDRTVGNITVHHVMYDAAGTAQPSRERQRKDNGKDRRNKAAGQN
jgi:hypothetical protein